MKSFLCTFFFLLLDTAVVSAQSNIDSLLKVLDDKIEHKDIYFDKKEEHIKLLQSQKTALKKAAPEAYLLNQALYKEYKSYVSDSAIHYLDLNMDIAFALKDASKINETNITSASLFAQLGMYKEASDLLTGINVISLNKQQRLDYSIAYGSLYLGLGQHSQYVRMRRVYWDKAKLYYDSVRQQTLAGSEEYLRLLEKTLRLSNDYDKALAVNDQRLKLIEPYSPSYALVTFHRSLIYRKMKDKENEKRYLALSAVSDIQHAVRDNASISILADILMREGDINRAYNYICFSLENIQNYNTRVRSSEVLNIQTIIDKEYQNRNEKKNIQLKTLLAVASILSILLVISVVLLYKHMKKGQAFSLQLKKNNEELASFNQMLHNMNVELKDRNLEVAEANHIKEEYIVNLLDECSQYIVKLDDYRDMVHKKVRDRQYEDLYKITRDTSLKENESKALFTHFDTMFIHLFPDFIAQLNALLLDEEQIVLKKGEVLNTELRIFALIRLGIGDSSKIAKFLGYSVNTIYNYRTKMKNKSKGAREDFEARVKKIGAYS